MEMLKKDFDALLSGLKNATEKDILVKQANGIFNNYVDLIEENSQKDKK